MKLISLVTLTLLYQLATTEEGYVFKKKCIKRPEGCSQIPQGLSLMRKGVDITKLDLHPIDGHKQTGLLKPLITYKCDENKGFSSYFNDVTYQVPDQIWHISSSPTGVMSARAETMRTSDDVRKYLNVEVGFSASSPMGSFSFSMTASYKHMERKCVKEEKSIQDVSSYESSHSVYFLPAQALKLDAHAQYSIDKLKNRTFKSDRKLYNKFVEEYGTHYFSRADFGGRLRLYRESSKTDTSSSIDQEAALEAEATFLSRIKVKISAKAGKSEKKENTKESSSEILKYYGGTVNIFDKGMSDWANSVDKAPWLISGDLKPITDLIEDCEVRANMEKAVYEYVMRKYLTALDRRLKYETSEKRYEPEYAVWVQKLLEIRTMKDLVEEDVKALSDDINYNLDIPDWFRSSKICLRKKHTGDAGQCDGYKVTDYCSTPNQTPHWYTDDTNNADGGCKMQWGIITSDAYPVWFSKVELCYKFHGPKSFCSRGQLKSGTIYCAPINSFTPMYEDDTDDRSGACLMSWSLKVRRHAPLWFRRVKLCFDAVHTDSKGSDQCQFKGSRRCVNNNEWTDYYRDSTDERPGACRMRWRLTVD